jgi:hypothetical protein
MTTGPRQQVVNETRQSSYATYLTGYGWAPRIVATAVTVVAVVAVVTVIVRVVAEGEGMIEGMVEGWTSAAAPPRSRGFRHDALLYRRRTELVRAVSDFVADGLVRGEPAIVVLPATDLEELRAALGGSQMGVVFLDADVVGRDPGRLIPTFYEFVCANGVERPSRGVGEPVGLAPAGNGPRDPAACEVHEALLELAFARTAWWLVCPYEARAADPPTVDEAGRRHRFLFEGGERRPSPAYTPITLTRPMLAT